VSRRTPLPRVPAPDFADRLRRLVWSIVQATLYRWSPVPFHGWRRGLLRLFGAQIDAGAHPYPDAAIWAPWHLQMGAGSCLGPRVQCYNVAMVSLGDAVVVSQGVHLCSASHDYEVEDFALVAAPIQIGARAWIAADAFVGPGVVIGDGAILAARAVAMQDVAAGTIAAGVPARALRLRVIGKAPLA
jgi:putative colanic acid biosynthesis acetyltransferase WcaF